MADNLGASTSLRAVLAMIGQCTPQVLQYIPGLRCAKIDPALRAKPTNHDYLATSVDLYEMVLNWRRTLSGLPNTNRYGGRNTSDCPFPRHLHLDSGARAQVNVLTSTGDKKSKVCCNPVCPCVGLRGETSRMEGRAGERRPRA